MCHCTCISVLVYTSSLDVTPAFCKESTLTAPSPAGSRWTQSRHFSSLAVGQHKEAATADSAASQIPEWEKKICWLKSPTANRWKKTFYQLMGVDSHLRLSPYGGKLLRALVGLNLILSPPGGQVEGGHHGHHLLQASGRHRHSYGGGRGQGQAHGPSSHCDGLLDVGELHWASLPDNGV